MLRTRLWMGAILAVLVGGVLLVDQKLTPWFPFLLLNLIVLMLASCWEFLVLLGPARRPPPWLCYAAVFALIVSNWPAYVLKVLYDWESDPWHWVGGTFVVVVLSAFLTEMASYREPGGSVRRIAFTILIAAYLGLLPSFFAQLRWPPRTLAAGEDADYHGTLALALTVFVPKCGDIGAYMAGRFLGRHKMTPVLSPKKTWEGFAGGMATSVAMAVLLNRFGHPLPGGATWLGDLAAVGFGVTVGGAGVLGDLAESLVKRDCGQKDASQTIPGFGGVLDVVDSVIFAAPVAYCWLKWA
jgi:phosphatidate cytidylyltransferase